MVRDQIIGRKLHMTLSDHSESGSDESEVPHANATSPEPAVKRVRKSNTMVGSVRGGKYSKRK
jgi:hypothetical protein